MELAAVGRQPADLGVDGFLLRLEAVQCQQQWIYAQCLAGGLQAEGFLLAQLGDVAGEGLGEADGRVGFFVGDRDLGNGHLVGGPDRCGS
ncbi:hypothetical protein [Streptomyces cinereoruber]|uniref:hypothetical protein n=1 Tax=Streptomyces cinereoruber TaxID=67260 RepID=UPI003C2CDBA8